MPGGATIDAFKAARTIDPLALDIDDCSVSNNGETLQWIQSEGLNGRGSSTECVRACGVWQEPPLPSGVALTMPSLVARPKPMLFKEDEMVQQVPDDRARQGPLGRPVLGVLLGSLLLIAVAVGGYLIWVGSTSPDHPGTDAARSATTGSTTGSNANPTNRTLPENPAYPVPEARPSANEAPKQ